MQLLVIQTSNHTPVSLAKWNSNLFLFLQATHEYTQEKILVHAAFLKLFQEMYIILLITTYHWRMHTQEETISCGRRGSNFINLTASVAIMSQ